MEVSQFDRALAQAPSVAGMRALRLSTGGFFFAGGILGIFAALTMDGDGVARVTVTGIGLLGAISGLGILALGQHLPRQGYHAAVMLGTLMVSAAVILADGRETSVALSTVYLFGVIDAILLFTLRVALMQIALSEVACAASLAIVGVPVGDIVVIAGSSVVVAVSVGWLSRAAQAAEEDPLTLLLNRRGFDRRLEEELSCFHRTGSHLSVVVLDLDHFKTINDEGGHDRGDRVLVECARVWGPVVPEGSSLARYGGDEFALLLPGLPLGPAADLADELRSLSPYGVRISSGVAAAQQGDSGSTLVNRADVALYEAKTTGRDRTVAHGDPDRSASELEQAIEDGQMVLHLQPVVQLSTDEVTGYEALVRWRHPTKGLIPPLDFVPEAERTGAIHSLGAWVLEEAARLTMTCAGPRRRIGVNVSVHELRTDSYLERVAEVLGRWQMPGRLLVVEVTESVFDLDDPLVLENLCGLRELGVGIAIDDFGAGYSSLGRLEELPIDLIKVDGSLIEAIRPDTYEAPILEAIVAMARSLGVRVLAERVETAHQAAVLKRLGYDLVQGYLFGRPQPR
ncbi:putative bifunctional diguanylate cyclase/phosphodiesterase [Nocardioides sp. Kera G14]|uniref:putative bifunctional diguanylate cyclase/phosphodiesterase n=1 Tax=Nocardioides sp. Kera G14 TaxID=2884264 RepID=UPI001D1106E3|nr:bifunctional diguanylate cyclase/phosphodiesterase [Nocardioides sp. Kera G14]UDY23008.1 bifunctional diguanylate cyclase/phosphodiesterase [Nocardioides sp. Kera G14]